MSGLHADSDWDLVTLPSPNVGQGHAMTKTKTDRCSTPVDQQIDPEVLAFRQQFEDRSSWGQKIGTNISASETRGRVGPILGRD